MVDKQEVITMAGVKERMAALQKNSSFTSNSGGGGSNLTLSPNRAIPVQPIASRKAKLEEFAASNSATSLVGKPAKSTSSSGKNANNNTLKAPDNSTFFGSKPDIVFEESGYLTVETDDTKSVTSQQTSATQQQRNETEVAARDRLNSSVQQELKDSVPANSYGSARVRYLKAIDQLRPKPYDLPGGGDTDDEDDDDDNQSTDDDDNQSTDTGKKNKKKPKKMTKKKRQKLVSLQTKDDRVAVRRQLRRQRDAAALQKSRYDELRTLWMDFDNAAQQKSFSMAQSADDWAMEQDLNEIEDGIHNDWVDFCHDVAETQQTFFGQTSQEDDKDDKNSQEIDTDLEKWQKEAKKLKTDAAVVKERRERRKRERTKALQEDASVSSSSSRKGKNKGKHSKKDKPDAPMAIEEKPEQEEEEEEEADGGDEKATHKKKSKKKTDASSKPDKDAEKEESQKGSKSPKSSKKKENDSATTSPGKDDKKKDKTTSSKSTKKEEDGSKTSKVTGGKDKQRRRNSTSSMETSQHSTETNTTSMTGKSKTRRRNSVHSSSLDTIGHSKMSTMSSKKKKASRRNSTSSIDDSHHSAESKLNRKDGKGKKPRRNSTSTSSSAEAEKLLNDKHKKDKKKGTSSDKENDVKNGADAVASSSKTKEEDSKEKPAKSKKEDKEKPTDAEKNKDEKESKKASKDKKGGSDDPWKKTSSTSGLIAWTHQPTSCKENGRKITVTVPPKTDYWRKTRHNFIMDNAPFYWHKVSGDFEVLVHVTGKMETMYDKAGIMIRHDAETWAASCLEQYHGVLNHSTSVTRDFTDWSLCPLPQQELVQQSGVWLCMKRIGNTFESFYSMNGNQWTQTRQGMFPDNVDAVRVGIFAACPMGKQGLKTGLTVEFDKFSCKTFAKGGAASFGTMTVYGSSDE